MTTSDSGAAGPLTLENRRQHEAHEETRLDFLEAVIQLDLEGARARFAALRRSIEEHLALEEARVLPALGRVLQRQLDEGRGELSGTVQHVEGDHRILERTFDKCEALLARLEAEAEGRRRALVRELDTFLLLGRVLEHHTAREDRLVYPLLDSELPDDERHELLGRLRALPSPGEA